MAAQPRMVGVFFGGPSQEFDVSCQSGAAIAQALEEAGYEVFNVGVALDGRWYGPVATADIRHFDPRNGQTSEIMALAQPGTTLYRKDDGQAVVDLDVAFPIIHGTFGEDGHFQALFDIMGLPYVGAPMAASAVGMDKVYMRDIFQGRGLPQVAYEACTWAQWKEGADQVLDRVEAALAYPIFVKPANAGSSVGISKVQNRQALFAGAEKAFEVDRKILFEQGLQVRELELSVLGNDEVFMAGPGEVVAGAEFYDYEAKYQSGTSQTVIPADIPAEIRDQVHALAKQVVYALDLRGFSRIDFFLTSENALLINEVNTLPGFTPISMYAKLWQAEGISLAGLVDRLVQLGLNRDTDSPVQDPALR